ncbi:MAG: radical SAM protein, partial [Treponema sp.]|nr:radical SAM protein [Treponema sp.]
MIKYDMRLTGGKQAQTPLFALSGTPPEELEKILSPLPRFRAAQILKWIASGISSFDSMGNLPAPLRGELALRFRPRPEAAGEKFPATDGTVKLVLRFGDGARIESVLLNDGRSAPRYTACLSTQAGCPAGCVFCRTGQHFQRSLESAEIVEQFIRLKALAEELSPEPGERQPGAPPVSNIVVMGMGEPLLNLEELRRALAVITCKQGFNFSRRRITVSTCGIPRAIADLADNGPAVRLALSLTT